MVNVLYLYILTEFGNGLIICEIICETVIAICQDSIVRLFLSTIEVYIVLDQHLTIITI